MGREKEVESFFVQYSKMKFLLGTRKVHVGASAIDNWKLLDESSPGDIWFHVHHASSAYVILEKTDDEPIPDDVIFQCAKLCKKHSKERTFNRSIILYCPVGNLKKGKTIGSVHVIKPAPSITVYE